MSDPPARIGGKKGKPMYQATIAYRSTIGGESSVIITDYDLNLFHAKVVGAMQGLTYGGTAVVTSVTSGKVDA